MTILRERTRAQESTPTASASPVIVSPADVTPAAASTTTSSATSSSATGSPIAAPAGLEVRAEVVGRVFRGELRVEVRNAAARPHGLTITDGFTGAQVAMTTPAGSWNCAPLPISGSYDVRVAGTDGVIRQFTGSGNEGLEVSSRWTVDGRFLVTIAAERDTIVRVVDAFRRRGHRMLVRYDEPQVLLVDTRDGHYDLAVTAKSLPGWSRRLVG